MKILRPRKAGIISVIFAILIITVFYTVFGTVDLVFIEEGGKRISRVDDVSMFSEVELPEGELTYTVNGETKPLDYITDLKAEIGATVLTNFINFKWQETDNVIVITQE